MELTQNTLALLKGALNRVESDANRCMEEAVIADAQAARCRQDADANFKVVAELRALIPADHPVREEFDSMMPHQQAHFGSFDAYVAMHEKLDAPEPELQVKWIAAADLTEDQIKGAMGEHNGTYAINVDDLTDEQRGA